MAKHVIAQRYTHPAFPRLQIQLRTNSRYFQAWTFLDGKARLQSLKTTQFMTAMKLAEEWYKRLIRSSVQFGMAHPVARLTTDPTMAEVFSQYCSDLDSDKAKYQRQKWAPIAPFWASRLLSSVEPKTFKDFYAWRRKQNARVKQVKAHTLHKDVVLIRQILKYAVENELISAIPFIPKVGKIEANPRPWLEPNEWKHLVHVSEQRIEAAKGNPRTQGQRQDLHDLILFLYHTACRVGEVQNLRFRDCRIETNKHGDKMLIAEVTGKRGSRVTVAPAGAVEVYERRFKASGKDPHALIFQSHPKDGFANLLEAAGLRKDRHGFVRNLKSLRATAISAQILRQPDLNLTIIARNVGTSVAMIDNFYAKRLTAEMHKDVLSAIR